MKTILKALSAVALTGVMVLPVLADDATTTTDGTDSKDLKKVIEDQGINYVETAQKGITLSGYVDVSYTNEFAGRGAPFGDNNPGASSVGGTNGGIHQFDTNADGFNVQAVKLALEKALPDKNEWAAGFRVDTILGSDARGLGDAAFGDSNGGSGLALEQALVKFRIPIGNGLDIYAGKFVTLLGYEVIESPANPNFSRGLLFTNAIPLTNTGVYADYKFNDTFEAKFGVVDGWNNSESLPSNDPQASYGFGGKALTGQLNINNPGKNANITQSFIYSPDSNEPIVGNTGPTVGGGDNGPSVVYDIWGNWNPTFDKGGNTTLGFNIDLGYNGASGDPVTGGSGNEPQALHEDTDTWWGIALYSIYKFNKVFTLAGRAEYLHDSAGANPIGGNELVDGTSGNKFGAGGTFQGTPGTASYHFTPGAQDDYSYTLTATFNIWDNLLTRAEYRIDDLSGDTTGSTNTIANEVSLEAVYSF